MNRYILITAARNEQENIESTIKAIKYQTLLPEKWVICLNGSTDNTETIIRKYVSELPFIYVHNLPEITKPAFSRKAAAIMDGYKKIKNDTFNFIGVLDADVTLAPYFYEKLIEKFINFPELGLATGDLYDIQKNGCYKLVNQPRDLVVAGCAQFFRKKCFDDIGGYREISIGGIDTLAAVMVRMHGWRTCTFEDLHCYHNRTIGTKYTSSKLIISFNVGFRDKNLGMHPLYAIIKSISMLTKPPYIVGSLFWAAGFLYGFIKRKDKNIPSECKKFLQKEQINRLKSIVLSNCD